MWRHSSLWQAWASLGVAGAARGHRHSSGPGPTGSPSFWPSRSEAASASALEESDRRWRRQATNAIASIGRSDRRFRPAAPVVSVSGPIRPIKDPIPGFHGSRAARRRRHSGHRIDRPVRSIVSPSPPSPPVTRRPSDPAKSSPNGLSVTVGPQSAKRDGGVGRPSIAVLIPPSPRPPCNW
ncbi:hypothetical protein DFJ74DRAFT_434516 [Hyaloraphidium curvatum]|nr:hypothetical protein DFJ74DRAFT_434516 [Hyaloraphidium curvatum]